jgi:phosphoenolpyruvate synthase/pyruvate phosphate dikinase
MAPLIRTFDEMTVQEQALAGGKGGTLARLFQAGYPVPEGFVILPAAFGGDKLVPEAWPQVQSRLNHIRRKKHGTAAFAVRSSALSEDSAQASFAGEFETVLDVHTDGMIRAAIQTVRQSRSTERVRVYSEAKGMARAFSRGMCPWLETSVAGPMVTSVWRSQYTPQWAGIQRTHFERWKARWDALPKG